MMQRLALVASSSFPPIPSTPCGPATTGFDTSASSSGSPEPHGPSGVDETQHRSFVRACRRARVFVLHLVNGDAAHDVRPEGGTIRIEIVVGHDPSTGMRGEQGR